MQGYDQENQGAWSLYSLLKENKGPNALFGIILLQIYFCAHRLYTVARTPNFSRQTLNAKR